MPFRPSGPLPMKCSELPAFSSAFRVSRINLLPINHSMSSIATNVQENPPVVLADLLATLADRRPLAESKMRAAMREMMAGAWNDTQIAFFLAALREKGETGEEIAAAASVLRENMIRLDAGPVEALDTCGTGGDGLGTFNISTAAALVVAGAGVPVVKHGNRASSSRTGSAHALAALGLEVDSYFSCAKPCLDRAGFAFC